jgi:hypothetical protein
MTSHLARTDGLLSLERTGLYIPPITRPGIGDFVVNAAGRRLPESAGIRWLDRLRFSTYFKALIVNLNWEDWDIAADDPPEYPKSGEPGVYILERPHYPVIARQMGDVWELVIPIAAVVGRSTQRGVRLSGIGLKPVRAPAPICSGAKDPALFWPVSVQGSGWTTTLADSCRSRSSNRSRRC